MKRMIFIVVFLLIGAMALPAQARSRTWKIYLTNDISTGVTTAPSGTSIMIVEGGGVNRSQNTTVLQGLQFLKSDIWVIQVDDITISQASAGETNPNYSGATFTLRYKESLYSGTEYLNKALTVDVIAGMPLSGNTKRQVQIYPDAMGIMQWEFISGITAFSGVTVMVRAFDWGVK